MPSFEDSENTQSTKETYTPSQDAKPRTRRRSGGFKTERASTQTGFGEVDPKNALKSEKLSGRPTPEVEKPAKKAAPKTAAKPAAKKEPSKKAGSIPQESTSKANPSPETLAAIQRVEERIEERKKERDAKRAERDKKRPEKAAKKAPAKKAAKKKHAKQQGGLITSILKFFGLGPKEPVKKSSRGPKREGGNRGKGGNRPQGKGGKRPQGKGGSNNRGGQGRRRGGQGGNHRRSQGRRNSETAS